MNIKKRQKK